MLNGTEMHCRVCGLPQGEPPWGEDGCTPSFQICDCCGTEFGYEDCTPGAAKRARENWVAKGSPWFEQRSRPVAWDVNEQLAWVPHGFG